MILRCWHQTVMPVLSLQVRYEEVNGPSSVVVRGPFLTHFGYRQQFSEPCDLMAWGKHQSERFTAAISPKSKKWALFWGVCEMVHIRGARVLLVMPHRTFPLRDCLGKAVWIGLALLGF